MFIPLFDAFAKTLRVHDIRTGSTHDFDALRSAIVALVDTQFRSRISPGETVVIGSSNPVSVLVTLFASWANGNKVVLVNPGLKSIEQETVIRHTKAAHWFGDFNDNLLPFLVENRPEGLHGFVSEPLKLDDHALVLMTSGTTGTPKGIVHSVRTLKTRLALNLRFLAPQTLQNTLCVLPLFFGHGLIGNCLTPLAAGQCVHLWPTPVVSEIAHFGDVLDENEISFMSSVPTFWKLALRMERPKKSNLKRISIGSAPLSVVHWNAVKEWTRCSSVFNMYGMTETANWIGGGDLADAAGRDGFVGRIWGGSYAIRTDEGIIKTVGRGEVLVDSPSTMIGYLDAEQTRQAMVGEWFRTGDIGELDEHGSLVLVGRSKTEINRGGIKILAEEIDMMLERHPAIAEACAFGIPDDVAGEAVAAAVILRQDAKITPTELRTWCLTQVRTEAVPQKLYFVDAIPKNDRGKIVRRDVMTAVTGGTA